MKTKYKCFIYKGGNKMRQSYNGAILTNSIDENKGINLGADFCAEHEWGILRLSDYLGIDTSISNFGIGRRKITRGELVGGGTIRIKGRDCFLIYCAKLYACSEEDKKDLNKVMKFCNFTSVADSLTAEKDFVAAWSENSFMILFNTKYIDFGKELLNACNDNNVLMFISKNKNSNSFTRKGLTLVMIDKEDEKVLEKMRCDDEDYFRLITVASETGIYKILKDAKSALRGVRFCWINRGSHQRLPWYSCQRER
jgi:hypothetical protein